MYGNFTVFHVYKLEFKLFEMDGGVDVNVRSGCANDDD